MRARQRAADAQHGAGDVRLERPAPGTAPVTVAGLEALHPLGELREFGGEVRGSIGGVLAQYPRELLGVVAPKSADSMHGTASHMDG